MKGKSAKSAVGFGPESSEHPAQTLLYWRRKSATRVVLLQRPVHKNDEYFPLLNPVLVAYCFALSLGEKLSVGNVCFRLKLRIWEVLAKTIQPHLRATGGKQSALTCFKSRIKRTQSTAAVLVCPDGAARRAPGSGLLPALGSGLVGSGELSAPSRGAACAPDGRKAGREQREWKAEEREME